MIIDTRDKIIEYIAYHGQARVHDLVKTFLLSNVAIHRQLKKLLQEGIIKRFGKPPLVFYKFPSREKFQSSETELLSQYYQLIIQESFLSITPDGRLLYGMEGFFYWAQTYQKRNSIATLAKEYISMYQQQKKHFSKGGWIDATVKLKNTFKEVFVDHLLYKDMYSYRIFGPTKLAKLVMYAKQVGAKNLITTVSLMTKPLIEKIIKSYTIDTIVYIPPTVPRPIQFMDEFASQLNLLLPEIELVKIIPGDIPIPQKTLASVEERTINARDSIYLKNAEQSSYGNVLLIDDVVGSGASFNETASKLNAAKVGYKNIVAFALVGNIKGYDVVREI